MNRKRVLWPLVLAATFALGVLAAQVHAGAIFLPLMAKASTDEETPTPPPSGTVRVENVQLDSSQSAYYGELLNDTGCTVHVSRVLMSLLRAEHLPVVNMTGYCMAPLLSPGERTPFRVPWYADPYSYESYLIQPDWQPVDRLTIESAVLTEMKGGVLFFRATVRNQLLVPVKSVSVGIVLYNLAGEVIAYDGPRHVLRALDPGDTLEVWHTFFGYLDPDPGMSTTCAAFAVPSGDLGLSAMEQDE